MTLRRRQLIAFGAAGAAGGLLGCNGPSSAPSPARDGDGSRSSPGARPEILVARPSLDGQGARLRRLFPLEGGHHLDPFVLFDDFGVAPPAGFPMHPHRGFEAFTYMLDGSFEHSDTMGNHSVVSSGGTQRFTSGRGARHSEMPAEPRPNRGIQLWVNLPRRLKRMEPSYQAVEGRDIPEESRGEAVVRTVVGRGSPVALESAVSYLDVALPSGARFEHAIEASHRGLAYVVDGAVRLGDADLAAGQAGLVGAGAVALRALAAARIVLVTGRPHDEPIVHRGPYVD
jgi:redox-sensitive bicupin YhaK (pirin superfamily)